MRLFVIIFNLMLCFCVTNATVIETFPDQPQEKSMSTHASPLSGAWQFRKSGDAEWLPAVVPGCVHEDLLRNGRIPDPYKGCNETLVQWVETEDWEYQLEFDVTPDFLESFRNAELVFSELDTYTEIILNNASIGQTDNMFSTFTFPVKQHLHVGKNTLFIRFHSPLKVNIPKLYQIPYTLPAGNDAHTYKVSVFSRKAPYHFGWDWGPRLVTSGIRKPVTLIGWNSARITATQILQAKIDTENASLVCRVHIQADTAIENYRISVDGFSDTTVNLAAGVHIIDIPFTIQHPRLWFPRGYGNPELYTFHARLLQDEQIIDSSTVTTGLRAIELIQEKDSIGESYYFKVNGIPVFAKGADYIPQDNMIGRVTAERHRKLIADVCIANMNMLRIWGGGYYEDEYFYSLCDSNGILVWQDFMFACSMYPGDTAFLASVAEEARQQVIRLSNHPSIALWCGNNEVDVAWKNWGWQVQFMFNPKDSAEVKAAYDAIFKNILPAAVRHNDMQKAYVHTTPLSNWGKPEFFTSGSMHYWGVWHGDEPFSAFKQNVPRFMAEYGFQSFPSMPAVRQFADKSELSLQSETMKLHQKSYKGNKSISKYLEPLYGKPKSFESFVYLSHLTQAEGIAYAIRCHRLKKGYCMGTLFWQLNDSWFGPSWSAIDYSGRKKALYYFSGKMYRETIAIIEQEKNNIFVSAVHDGAAALKIRAEISVRDFAGKTYFEKTVENVVPGDKSISLYNGNPLNSKLLINKKKLFVRVRLYNEQTLLDEQLHYFVTPNKLALPKPAYTVTKDLQNNTISIHAKSFVKNLYLETDTDGVDFSDNYFDMLPGETKTITIRGKGVPADLRIRSLWDYLQYEGFKLLTK